MTNASNVAVILGASEWPEYESFETRPAFQNSANFYRDYLLREDGLGLPPENLLWLFDDAGQPAIVVEKIAEFLRARAASDTIRNVFVFYVGHGGYINKDYFVALRCTSQKNRELTSLPVRFIAKALYEQTPDKRHIVVVDACYASGAVKDFIYQDAGVVVAEVREQIREILPELDIEKGSALFCSAGPKSKAKAPWEGEYTMFSGAMQRVLSTGEPTFEDYLSLEEVAGLVEKDIFNTFRAEGVRPELHTPKQEKGDIRSLRVFPNAARRKELESRTARKLREDLDGMSRSVDALRKELSENRAAANAASENLSQMRAELQAALQYSVAKTRERHEEPVERSSDDLDSMAPRRRIWERLGIRKDLWDHLPVYPYKRAALLLLESRRNGAIAVSIMLVLFSLSVVLDVFLHTFGSHTTGMVGARSDERSNLFKLLSLSSVVASFIFLTFTIAFEWKRLFPGELLGRYRGVPLPDEISSQVDRDENLAEILNAEFILIAGLPFELRLVSLICVFAGIGVMVLGLVMWATAAWRPLFLP